MFNLLLLALVACGDKEATTETTAQNENTEQTETNTNDNGTPIVQELPEGSYPATEEVSLIAPDGDTTTTGETLDKIQKDLDQTIETIDEIKEILNDETQTSTETTETQTENK
jgi:hypothetical protein